MAARSKIELDPRLKDAADEAIRRGATVDEMLAALKALNPEVSRSSVGRYAKKARVAMERYREVQDIVKVWAEKFGSEPDSDIGQLVGQLLRTVAFNQASTMANTETTDDDAPSPRDVMLLAAAIKDLASADKISAERILKVRKETATKAADKAVAVAKAGGMSRELVDQLRAAVIGTAT